MIKRLDHVNIRTRKFAETVEFYTELLGLRQGPIPGVFSIPTWLHDSSDAAIIHLIPVDPDRPQLALDQVRARLGDLAGPLDETALTRTGTIDHIAFECVDYDAMAAQLTARGLEFHTNEVAGMKLRQIFVNDPNDVTLELNFRG
jgi:catechol 2,3-dioxygenase-like lactoylglutathione lyase family enzyme